MQRVLEIYLLQLNVNHASSKFDHLKRNRIRILKNTTHN